MLDAVLVVLQAAAALVAFVFGILIVEKPNGRWYGLYFGALVAAALFWLLDVRLTWLSMSNVARQTTLGLGILIGYALFRAGHAGTEDSERFDEDWHDVYRHDVAFTLYALPVCAIMVTALTLDAPANVVGWLVVASLAAGLLLLGGERIRARAPVLLRRRR